MNKSDCYHGDDNIHTSNTTPFCPPRAIYSRYSRYSKGIEVLPGACKVQLFSLLGIRFWPCFGGKAALKQGKYHTDRSHSFSFSEEP